MTDRFTTETVADPITYDLDPAHLGAPVAEAIRLAVVDGIRALAPRFNRTGHLRDGIRVEQQGDQFLITAPADRLQAAEVMEQLAELVPAIRDPLSVPAVAKAVEATIAVMIKVG